MHGNEGNAGKAPAAWSAAAAKAASGGNVDASNAEFPIGGEGVSIERVQAAAVVIGARSTV
jgi:hypothetical protein